MSLTTIKSTKKTMFAEVFYRQHRKHILRIIARFAVLLVIVGAAAGFCLLSFFRAKGEPAAAAVTTSVFVFLAWIASQRIRDQLRARLVPYFERPLGNITTFLRGKDLLLYSRRLDETALQLGVRPLSEFASGDDMIRGETLNWFPPDEAPNTLERLLQPHVAENIPSEVVSDLSQIRNALNTARSRGVRFCFLIREGTSVSGAEMDRRKGSFF